MNQDSMQTKLLKRSVLLIVAVVIGIVVGAKYFQMSFNMAEGKGDMVRTLCEVLNIDQEVAQYYLDKMRWSVEGAINEYYADTTGIGGNKIPVDKPPSYTEREASHITQSGRQDLRNSNPTNFKLLSWNLDGLDVSHIEERTEAVVKTILFKQPDIVILQEVVPYSLKVFRNTCEGYMVLVGDYTVPYFNAILVRKSSVQTKETALQFVPFPTSNMGRHYLIQPIKFADAKIIVMTSHLESMGNNAAERKKQFKEVLDYMKRQNDGFNIIFGGDTNLRDKEVTAIGGLPEDIQDTWESCGSQISTKFTWDAVENDNIKGGFGSRLRFDRIFLRAAKTAKKLSPKTFTLTGKERLENSRMFPSDHWAVWLEFGVQD